MTNKKETTDFLSQQPYLGLFDNIRSGIVVVNLYGIIQYANTYSKKIFGFNPRDNIKGTNAFNFFLPEYRSKAIDTFTSLIRNRQSNPDTFQKIIYKVKNTKNIEFWIETDSFALDYNNKQTILVCFNDITRTKNYEALYNESEQLFRSVVDNSHDGILLLNKENKIVYTNTRMCLILQKTPDELVDTPILDIFEDESQKVFKANVLDNHYAASTSQRIIYTAINKIKEKRLVELSYSIISNSQADTITVIQMLDITERKMMEEDLLNIKKLESVGLLAGGIAHDFNNILNAILGNLSLLKMDMENPSEKASLINDAERAVLRAKGLTNQLLTFSKGGEPIKKILHIDTILKEAVQLALTGSNISHTFKISKTLMPTLIDEGQFHQVINNLVLNAKQAMPEGGTLHIGAKNTEAHANNRRNLKPGKYISIQLRDNGPGIEKKYIKKIFDPYFSTKDNGQGLGLTSAYSIINKHNGILSVDSEAGKGTTFSILLPASNKKIKVRKEKKPQQIVTTPRGHILFMDDEEMVRSVAKKMLEKIGCTVECVKDGEEAITIYNKNLKKGKPFDAVIMDLTVPGGMGGKETICKLQSISPDIKAVVSSGYSNDPVMANYKKYGFADVIAKPFKIEELNSVLQNIICENEST